MILLLGFLVLCTLGTFMLRKGSLYLEKLNEKATLKHFFNKATVVCNGK